jgi:hypothetical protein
MVEEAVRANAEAIKGLPPVASSQLCLGGDVLGGDQVSQVRYVGWSTRLSCHSWRGTKRTSVFIITLLGTSTHISESS